MHIMPFKFIYKFMTFLYLWLINLIISTELLYISTVAFKNSKYTLLIITRYINYWFGIGNTVIL